MADGGLLIFGFCAIATLAVIPTAILAAAVFGAPPQPQYVTTWRRQSGWLGGGGAVVVPAPGPGQAYMRVPIPQVRTEPPFALKAVPRLSGGGRVRDARLTRPARAQDGEEYLVVRADTFSSAAPAPAAAEGEAPALPPPGPAAEADKTD